MTLSVVRGVLQEVMLRGYAQITVLPREELLTMIGFYLVRMSYINYISIRLQLAVLLILTIGVLRSTITSTLRGGSIFGGGGQTRPR